MAEYIDREQIKYHRERVLNHWSGSRHTDCDVTYKDIVTKEDIDGLPAADVIERTEYEKLEKEYNHYKRLAEQDAELYVKISKAIEELERYSTHYEYIDHHDLADVVDSCIGTILKHIEE